MFRAIIDIIVEHSMKQALSVKLSCSYSTGYADC